MTGRSERGEGREDTAVPREASVGARRSARAHAILAAVLLVVLGSGPAHASGEPQDEPGAGPALASDPPPSGEPIASVGALAGWSIRQIAIDFAGGPQVDLTYQMVRLGASGQVFGIERWVGVRARVALELLASLQIDRRNVPPSFGQTALHAEVAPVFTWVFGTVGLHASAGVGFTHWFRGADDSEETVVAAQQLVQLPFTLGATILAGDIILTPELGAAVAVHYDSEQGSIRSALRDGTASARGLDLWLTLTIAAPL